MREMVREGVLRDLDKIGFYLLSDKAQNSEAAIRQAVPITIEGYVVVCAANIHEAMCKFYQHPGVVGTGRERPDKKAICFDDRRLVLELPGCDLDSEFEGGCFHVSPGGWAMCRWVENTPGNSEHGYCHCFLQGVEEPPTGCDVEEHCANASVDRDPVLLPEVRYLPLSDGTNLL